MTVAELFERMSAREFAEWAIALKLTDKDIREHHVEDDLLKIFGKPNGKFGRVSNRAVR
jgi:hypothetical protein